VLLQLFVARESLPGEVAGGGGTLACGSDPACWEAGRLAGPSAVTAAPMLWQTFAAVAASDLPAAYSPGAECLSPQAMLLERLGLRRRHRRRFTD